ncbi:adenosine receptor A2a-like, partial [Acipenser oxyrinchus oxyrinchus]
MLDADVIYIILELVIAVLAVLGNVLVCWAVCLNSNLQNVTNFFVVSLAVADIAVGVLAIPFAITISTGFCAHFHGCLFIACFVLVLTQSSIFSLLAIAVDRYIAIKIPLRYNGLVTGQRAKGIIAICWVLSVIIGLTPMLGWNKCTSEATNNSTKVNHIKCTDDRMMPCLFENVVTMDYMVYFNFFAFVLVPLLLMLGIYLRIFMAARHQLQLIELKAIQGEKCRSILQKEVHAAKSLAIIVGLFAVCWLPLHIINCFTYFCPLCPRPRPGSCTWPSSCPTAILWSTHLSTPTGYGSSDKPSGRSSGDTFWARRSICSRVGEATAPGLRCSPAWQRIPPSKLMDTPWICTQRKMPASSVMSKNSRENPA